MDILIPTYRRPERIAGLVKNITETTPEPHRIIFICDEGDSMREAFRRGAIGVMNERSPSYAGAINTGIGFSDSEWVFTGADDLEFTHGWLKAMIPLMVEPWCVIGTNDDNWGPAKDGTTATHMAVRTSYVRLRGASVDGPGTALHEGYKHYCCEQ